MTLALNPVYTVEEQLVETIRRLTWPACRTAAPSPRAARSCKPRCWQAVPSLAALDDQHAARCVLVDDHA
jgi:hypothetical protein